MVLQSSWGLELAIEGVPASFFLTQTSVMELLTRHNIYTLERRPPMVVWRKSLCGIAKPGFESPSATISNCYPCVGKDKSLILNG
jgi:hypothetical protein